MFSVNFKMASRSYTCSKKIIIMVKCTLWTPHSVHITLIIIFFYNQEQIYLSGAEKYFCKLISLEISIAKHVQFFFFYQVILVMLLCIVCR